MNKNYYDILWLNKNATLDEIKKSYRILAMKYHPDKNNWNKKFEEKFKEIKEAYEVLSNYNSRKEYDNNYQDKEQENYNKYEDIDNEETINSETVNKKSSILWRLLKVIYFVISLPIVCWAWFFVLTEQKVYRWTAYFSVNDYYLWAIYWILIILGYIFFTDLLRRIISYIVEWSFNWFFPYIKILKQYFWWIIIIPIILFSALSNSSTALRNECTWSNEWFNNYWVCSCNEWYIRKNWFCEITLKKLILNKIPYWSFLREYKEIPWKTWVYLWIYINNYTIDEEMNTTKDMPYSSCPEEVQWKWISWDYHLFTYENWNITSDLIVPLWFRETLYNAKLNLSYMNTKINNYYYFWWNKPNNDNENYNIELSDLINFKDYNWDWLKNEFLIFDHLDQSCWHNNYLVAWFDNIFNKVIIYWIKDKNWNITYWGDNFIPNEKWEVKNWWECWDHWVEDFSRNYYKYNSKSKTYDFIKWENWNCVENDSSLWVEIKQDVNLRDWAGSNFKVIKTILKWEYVKILDTTLVWWNKWYKVDYNWYIWWISDIWFQENKNVQSLTDTKKLFWDWFIPHNATININFYDDWTFLFNDFNWEKNAEEVLTWNFELIWENLTLKYNDRPPQSFRFYKWDWNDSNYYISSVSWYYFVKK